MGPEVGKQPGKIERLCFAWGPTIHPPTIIGLSVCPNVHPSTQPIHTSMHLLAHQPMNSNTIHSSTYLTHLPLCLSMCLSVHAHPIHSFLHPSFLTNLSFNLSVYPCFLVSVAPLVRTTHDETIMLALAHRVTGAAPDATTAFFAPCLSMTPWPPKHVQGPLYPRRLYLRLTLFLYPNSHAFSSQVSSQTLHRRDRL